jgi:hypothetical protein
MKTAMVTELAPLATFSMRSSLAREEGLFEWACLNVSPKFLAVWLQIKDFKTL